MIVTENIRLSRVLRITWKTDLIVLACCLAAYNVDHYLELALGRNYFKLPPIIPTVIGTALAFFIGFNNNQAYSRWWEARQIWGSLVNNSRSWARGILAYTPDCEESDPPAPRSHRRMILRHIGFLYALKAALRNQHWDSYKRFLEEEEVKVVQEQTNKHNAILQFQAECLAEMSRSGEIDGFKFTHLNNLLTTFTDDMGKSERIKGTVFPTSYLFFTKWFIWLFGILITIVAAETTGIWSVALGGAVTFVFQTTHLIGVELLNPFEPEAAGIPLDQITRTIEINLLEMMGEDKVPLPIKPINGEYVM